MHALTSLTLEQVGVIVVAVAAFLGVLFGAFKLVLAAGKLSERVDNLMLSIQDLTAALIEHERASNERDNQNSLKIEAVSERVATLEGIVKG